MTKTKGHSQTPYNTEETAVRVLLFNRAFEVLLQKISIPGRPEFYITPGGRLASPSEDLVTAAIRELKEETGFSQFKFQSETPSFSGSHVMTKSKGLVKMTEHFFVVTLEEREHKIDVQKQSLTPKEREIFAGQRWMGLEELRSGKFVIVPVNIVELVEAIQSGKPMPAVDFRDPPELAR